MHFKKLISTFMVASVVALSTLTTIIPEKVNADELLGATNFDDGVGLPWHTCETFPAKVDFAIENGVYTVTILNSGGASKGGEDRWDCQLRHRGIKLESGHTYEVGFTITASNDCSYYAKIGDQKEPFVEDWHGEPTSQQHDGFWDVKRLQANQPQTVKGQFTAKRTAEACEFAFHIGGESVPEGTVFTFDNMTLFDSQYKAPPKEEEWKSGGIMANQLGYFTNTQKKATLVSDSTSPVDFSVNDSSGKSLYSGKSQYIGMDKDSGMNVHIIDFSDFTTAGAGYTLSAGEAKSLSFDIAEELYSNMLYDSLSYFYQNRSGIEILSDYVSDPSLARAAGHTTDVANTQQIWGYTDSYSLDLTGGWYDAGDHGKYVVNGGISAWTMQNQYERAKLNGSEDLYADGTMKIPENGNGFPDILDEARYQMEFMLKMMVPDNYKYAGMVHHKVHDETWTGLAVAPAEDTKERIIKPPTTQATLNLAATAAQASRLWEDFDADFANKCLEAAKKAYIAAKANPEMYAALNEAVGGGAYGDDYAKDEFYWAAAELFITTGDSTYYDDMKASAHFLEMPTKLNGGEDVDSIGCFNWGNTSGLGTLSLALNKDAVDGGDFETVKNNITKASEFFIELENSQGFGIPLAQSTVCVQSGDESSSIKGYPWGSNSFVINSAILMGYAYDLTEDATHLNGLCQAMDYLLGRNPMDISYVTGYGSHYAENPHHRFWSYQCDSNYPKAPSGILVGGPNSGLQDPWVRGSGWKVGEKSPQLCYMDNIEAWSVNECTINWNSPLAWVAGYLTKEGNPSTPTGTTGTTKPDGSATGDDKGESSVGDKDTSESTLLPINTEGGTDVGMLIIYILAGIGAITVIALVTLGVISLVKSIQKNQRLAQQMQAQMQAQQPYPQQYQPYPPQNGAIPPQYGQIPPQYAQAPQPVNMENAPINQPMETPNQANIQK